MKYAMQSLVHVDEIKASVWVSDDAGRAILTFGAPLLAGSLSMHIPPAVAQATADAFNEAMDEHRKDEEMRKMRTLYKGEKAAGLHMQQDEIDAALETKPVRFNELPDTWPDFCDGDL